MNILLFLQLPRLQIDPADPNHTHTLDTPVVVVVVPEKHTRTALSRAPCLSLERESRCAESRISREKKKRPIFLNNLTKKKTAQSIVY